MLATGIIHCLDKLDRIESNQKQMLIQAGRLGYAPYSDISSYLCADQMWPSPKGIGQAKSFWMHAKFSPLPSMLKTTQMIQFW